MHVLKEKSNRKIIFQRAQWKLLIGSGGCTVFPQVFKCNFFFLILSVCPLSILRICSTNCFIERHLEHQSNCAFIVKFKNKSEYFRMEALINHKVFYVTTVTSHAMQCVSWHLAATYYLWAPDAKNICIQNVWFQRIVKVSIIVLLFSYFFWSHWWISNKLA